MNYLSKVSLLIQKTTGSMLMEKIRKKAEKINTYLKEKGQKNKLGIQISQT